MIAGGVTHIDYNSRSAKIKLYLISDIHWGARGCDERLFRQTIQEIDADPYALWIGLGDYMDLVTYNDKKRFTADTVAPWVKAQDLGNLGRVCATHMKTMFYPIRHKCLGLLLGNHETKYMTHNNQESLHGWLCEELTVPNLGYSCFFRLNTRRITGENAPEGLRIRRNTESPNRGDCWSIRVFAHHGAGGSVTKAGKMNRISKFMNDFDADLYLMGHVHDIVPVREVKLGINIKGESIEEREVLGVSNGSFLKTYLQGDKPTYGEVKAYKPSKLGPAIINIHPMKKAFDITY